MNPNRRRARRSTLAWNVAASTIGATIVVGLYSFWPAVIIAIVGVGVAGVIGVDD